MRSIFTIYWRLTRKNKLGFNCSSKSFKDWLMGTELPSLRYALTTPFSYLQKAIDLLKQRGLKDETSEDEAFDTGLKVIITVSPIRYAKYGYHGSQLSKATLQLAADRLVKANPDVLSYFPAYEIMNDELRDYRFYKEDMLHPSDQAVEYIWEKFRETYFGKAAEQFLEDWRPIREALGHKPFNPDSEEHLKFIAKTEERKKWFEKKYGLVTG